VVQVTDTLPSGQDKVRAVRAMFDTIAPRYDLVNRLMTFGLDRRWRRTTVSSLELPPRSLVLDVACGTGDLCRELTAAGHAAVGVDLSRGMLVHARAGGAPLVQADALTLPFPSGSADGAVSGFALRNVADLGTLFAELARVVRPGGRIALLEVAAPTNPVLRAGHKMWFELAVPRIGAALSDAAAYRYLPRSVAYLPPTADMLAALAAAGFADAQRSGLSGGITQLVTATSTPATGLGHDAGGAALTPAGGR
jgi:demethylmenaquinone methyltransferase/2-methoxy-6-polyprenyl-1,4-benzoquinol methylase